VALLATLHALVLKLFYRYAFDTCLEIDAKSPAFAAQAPGLAESPSALAVESRHQAWAGQLPKEPAELWDALAGFDSDSRDALFAHCIALTVNAVVDPYNRRPRAIAHADRIAQSVELDMAGAGWTPTVDNFLGRVTKPRILQAVREGCGEREAERIEHLKKGDMAAKAQDLLAGRGWVPEPLCTPGQPAPVESPADDASVPEADTAAAIAAE